MKNTKKRLCNTLSFRKNSIFSKPNKKSIKSIRFLISFILGMILFSSLVFGVETFCDAVYHYSFDVDASEEISGVNDGTEVGGVTHLTNTSCTTDGCYYFFEGDSINFPAQASGTNEYTVCMWVKIGRTNANDGLLGWDSAGSGHMDLKSSTNDWIVRMKINGVEQGGTGFGSYSANTWYHFCASLNASQNYNFIDGSLGQVQNMVSSDDTTQDRWQLGTDGVNEFRYGFIDEVTQWNRSLTRPEVETLYNSGSIYDYTTNCLAGDTSPPSITVVFPNETNLTYNYNLWVNFTTNEAVNCTINNTAFSDINNNNQSFAFNESSLPDGFYSINISCTDSAQNNASEITQVIKDTTLPIIDILNPSETNSTTIDASVGTMPLEYNITENRQLYYLDSNITGVLTGTVVYQFKANISGTNYYKSETLNTTEWYNESYVFKLRVCDSHTDENIKDASIVKDKKNIKFQWDNTIIHLKSESIGTGFLKLKDRYSFIFEFAEDSPNIKEFTLNSNNDIVHIINSEYNGHFIINNQYWVDFEPYDPVIEYRCETEGNETECLYHILIDTSDTTLNFESVGILSCNQKHVSFTLSPPSLSGYSSEWISSSNFFNFDVIDLDTTSGVLLMFFLFFIYVILVIFTEYTKIPIIGVLAGIYGIFYSMFVFVSMSVIAGIILIALSLMYIFRSIILSND